MSASAFRVACLLALFGVAMATWGVYYEPPNCTNSTQSFYPHTLCTLFYQCLNGERYTRFCRPFSYFDRIQLRCLPMSQVDCNIVANTTQAQPTQPSSFFLLEN